MKLVNCGYLKICKSLYFNASAFKITPRKSVTFCKHVIEVFCCISSPEQTLLGSAGAFIHSKAVLGRDYFYLIAFYTKECIH